MSKSNHRTQWQRTAFARAPLTAAITLAFASGAFAQDAAPAPAPAGDAPVALDEIVVTSQKRTQNLQKVPISLQVLGEQKLEEHHVADFDDFAKMLPALSYTTIGGGTFSGPGFAQVYMRGVASGGDGNHSGSQPSVGMYLDEQPITTIQGSLDIHVYDVARIEALAGPQGTLYGASSQSGTVRIITNKPDPSAFSGSAGVEVNTIDHGGTGYVAEGYVNAPISDAAAIRLVGWSKYAAGYVDNVPGTVTFPTSGITIDNADRVEDNYNDATTYGARAALGININDNWTITPTVMGQHQKAHGSAGYDQSVGDLELSHFYPENSDDRWVQAALTVQGKIGNFDLTYAYSNLRRNVDSESDYTDYGFWYDTLSGYGAYAVDNDGELINPAQHIQAVDGYRKTSHELRVSSPDDSRFRFVTGVFWQDQKHEIFQRYRLDDFADALEVPGYSDTIWLTGQERRDHDQAWFGEASFDFTDKLTGTAGLRYFRNRNSLRGFFGFGPVFSSTTGVSQCFSDESVNGGPCLNLDKSTRDTGHVGKLNLTYQFTDHHMAYLTWSEGYRPGGINRRGDIPYLSDFLTNYELGWKTSWLDNRLTLNGAVFHEKWNNFQFSYLGLNSLTEIHNAGQASINGLEADLSWAVNYNFRLNGGIAVYDAKLTSDYCAATDAEGNPVTDCADPAARSGTRLPATARFKGNVSGRYTWDIGTMEAFLQGDVTHQGNRRVDLRDAENALLGDLDGYTLFDLSAGISRDLWSLDVYLDNVFDTRTELSRFAECNVAVCGHQPYTLSSQPRTFGVRFKKDW